MEPRTEAEKVLDTAAEKVVDAARVVSEEKIDDALKEAIANVPDEKANRRADDPAPGKEIVPPPPPEGAVRLKKNRRWGAAICWLLLKHSPKVQDRANPQPCERCGLKYY